MWEICGSNKEPPSDKNLKIMIEMVLKDFFFQFNYPSVVFKRVGYCRGMNIPVV